MKQSDWLFGERSEFAKFESKMAAEPTRLWSDEKLSGDEVPKKDLIIFLQDNASHSVFTLPVCVERLCIKCCFVPQMRH